MSVRFSKSVGVALLVMAGIALFSGAQAFAADVIPEIKVKEWRTFRSEHGFEIKVPKCWEGRGNAYEEEVAPERMTSFGIFESQGCETPRWAKDMPNGLGIDIGLLADAEKTREEIRKFHNTKPSSFDIYYDLIENGEIFLSRSIQGENLLRWYQTSVCGSRSISISGGVIKPPPQFLVDRIKGGDWSIPEPFKTIYDSFKCIPATYKPKATPTPAPKKKSPQKK